MVAYENLDHIESNFGLIRIWYGNYIIISDIPQVAIPMQCLIHVKSQKNSASLCEMFVSYTAQECDNVTASYYQFTLYYLSRGRLWEVKNKRTFHTFNSKIGWGCLQKVVTYQRFLI